MTFLPSAMNLATTAWISALRFLPAATAFSSSVAMSSRLSATIVLRTTFGPAIDWLEPTARNSNLLPVKANGLVRLRSPASRGSVRQHGNADRHGAARLAALRATLLDLLDDVLEHVAQEDRDDGRRGFVGAEPVVVGGGGDRDAEQVAVPGHGAERRRPGRRGTGRCRAGCRPA